MPINPKQLDSDKVQENIFTRIKKKPFYHLIALLILVNITLSIINVGIYIIAARQHLFISADFTNFYTGFKMVLNGDATRLYDLGLQAKVQQQIMGNINFKDGLLPFVNPPFVAVLLSPLALLPINSAYYVWFILQLGFLIGLLILLNRTFKNWTRSERIIMSMTILAFWPLTITLMHGQFSLLLSVSIFLVYLSMRQSKLVSSGLWLAFCLIKPQSLPILGAMTLNRKYLRTAITLCLSVFGIIILTSVVTGFTSWLQYLQVLKVMSNQFGSMGFFANLQYTFKGILTNILGYSHAGEINLISSVVFVVGIALITLVWRKGLEPGSQRVTLYFAFSSLLSIFLSLHLYPHDDLMLVIPAVLFFDYLRNNNYPTKAYSVFILLSPLVFFTSAFTSFYLFGFISPPVAIILILLIWMGVYLAKESRLDRANSLYTNGMMNQG